MFSKLTRIFDSNNISKTSSDPLLPISTQDIKTPQEPPSGSSKPSFPFLSKNSGSANKYLLYNDPALLDAGRAKKSCYSSFSSEEGIRIQAESGTVYELPKFGSTLLGKGRKAKGVSVARVIDLDTKTAGELVAAKQFDSRELAEREFLNHKCLGDGAYFVPAFDIAHTASESFVFLKLFEASGKDALNILIKRKDLSEESKRQEILFIADTYEAAVDSLHAQGFCHGDILLENFLHGRNKIAISDYGADNIEPINDELVKRDLHDLGEVLRNIYYQALDEGIDIPEILQRSDYLKGKSGIEDV